MNKLLSAASAIGMLLAVDAAQAGEVMTAEQLDTVTAGAFAAISSSAQGFSGSGSFSLFASSSPADASASISVSGVPVGPAPNNVAVSAFASL